MSTRTVTETLIGPAGERCAHVAVTIRLAADAGYVGGSTIIRESKVVAGPDGVWTAALTPNAEIAPANTWYVVTRPGFKSVAIRVLAGGTAVTVQACLITPPADLDESALAVHLADVDAHDSGVVDGGEPDSDYSGEEIDGGTP
jgi:hypothetical protein